MSCAKAFLFFFNTIYLGVAAALIYVGAWIIKSYDGDYREITNDTYTVVPCGIIIGVGVLVFIMAIAGCCGTCQNSRCCLSTFFVLLLLVFCLEVTAGILGAVYRNKAEAAVEDGLEDAVNHYGGSNSAMDKALDGLQKEFHCCGSKGPSDWVEYSLKHLGRFPDSCCKDKHCFIGNVYSKGCYHSLLDELKSKLNYIIGIGAGFAVLQIFGMIGACVVMCRDSDAGYTRLHGGTRV